MLPNKINVTSIEGVLFVSRDRHPEAVSRFEGPMHANELIFHLSGDATVCFNGKRMHTVSDTVRFLPRSVIREYTVIHGEHGECIDIFFNTDVPLSEEAFLLCVTENKNLRSLFRRICSVWTEKREGYYHRCMSLFYEILYEISALSYLPEKTLLRIEPAVRYISEHYLTEEIRVPALAEACGMSESYLKRLFLAAFGLSPKKYITKLRMEHALELLRSNMFTVGEIAEKCGYESLYYFSRVFKESFGISPTHYREK